jgi:hypothetical protein
MHPDHTKPAPSSSLGELYEILADRCVNLDKNVKSQIFTFGRKQVRKLNTQPFKQGTICELKDNGTKNRLYVIVHPGQDDEADRVIISRLHIK